MEDEIKDLKSDLDWFEQAYNREKNANQELRIENRILREENENLKKQGIVALKAAVYDSMGVVG